ncbi:MAG: AAA family ATPase [Brevibacillus sp.]|nr:AAA family ATPase [Brevibacillus sp.]
MIIDELYIGGFGKWRDTAFSFAPGINLFVAPNEAGKTTLLAALFAALYGLKRDYLRTTRYLEDYDRYYPWDGGPYETIIRYRLDGQHFRLHRQLAKERDVAKLYREPELADITLMYQEDRRKEYNFVERHLGLNRTLFTDVTWVRKEPVQAARQLLPTLANQNEGDPLANALLAQLEQEISAIGRKESAASTLIGKLAKELEQAEQSLKQAELDWQSVQHLTREVASWQEDLNRKQRERMQLETKLELLRQAETSWQERWQRSFQTTRAAELAEWEKAAQDEAERKLHSRMKEQLLRLEQEMTGLREWTSSLPSTSRTDKGEFYLSFAQISEAEWQEWIEGWYALRVYTERHSVPDEPVIDLEKLQSDYLAGLQLYRETERLRNETDRLAARLEEAERADGNAQQPGFTDRQGALEPESTVSPISRTSRVAQKRKRKAARRSLAWYAAALFWMAGGMIGWWNDLQLPALAAWILAVCTAAVVWHLGRRQQSAVPGRDTSSAQASHSPAVASEFAARKSALQHELAMRRSQLEEAESALRRLLIEWDVAEWEAFVSLRERWLVRLHERKTRTQEEAERQRIQARLERKMLDWGVPPHLSFEEAAALVLSEHAKWEQRTREEQERLKEEVAQQKERMARMERLETLEKEQAELLEQWRSQVRAILLKDQQELEQRRKEAEAERSRLEEVLTMLRENIAQARGEIGQRGEIAWAKAKSNCEDIRARLDDARMRRDALLLAKEALEEAMEEWRRDISPALNQTASLVMKQISSGRYRDVRLDPSEQFAVRVIEPKRREIVEQDRFSSGTQDQLSFAQRVALLQTISAEREPLPIFLDDHFIHYDQVRLEAALDFLLELSESHQVFLFSCQGRECDYLQPVLAENKRHKLHNWSVL